eukprot:scaffold53235_cov68-Phaeocystis_antarctica.AAC.4
MTPRGTAAVHSASLASARPAQSASLIGGLRSREPSVAPRLHKTGADAGHSPTLHSGSENMVLRVHTRWEAAIQRPAAAPLTVSSAIAITGRPRASRRRQLLRAVAARRSVADAQQHAWCGRAHLQGDRKRVIHLWFATVHSDLTHTIGMSAGEHSRASPHAQC